MIDKSPDDVDKRFFGPLKANPMSELNVQDGVSKMVTNFTRLTNRDGITV